MSAVPQPAGIVSLVFTDIEGSTRLLDELGVAAYREALVEHRRVVREACARYAGYEVDYEGDAFFYAFASAQDAVSAVTGAMLGLEAGPIRIRVGIHTGEPALDPPKYVGLDVHLAARIMSAAHGGQVVLSPSTVALLEPGTVALRELGAHRLKDLSSPIVLHQLLVDGLLHTFPPLKTMYRSNLPVPATSFLGRERAVEDVISLLSGDSTRLVTLTGPGGTGKTRLALQAAAEASDRFPDGVWWAPLAPIRDSALTLPAIAGALDIAEEPGRPLGETIVERIGGKQALVLIDNAEHLLPALAGELAPLVRDTGTVRFLVTSRERLRVGGEHVYSVSTLEPSTGVELFLQRAAAAGVELEPTLAVLELCARLDQLPLALELAAARVTLFAPDQLVQRLGDRLDLLRGGRDADPRQATLRTTIAWSHDLLDADEKRVFAALGVFAGGCTYAGAEAVAAACPETLESLIDKSLVRRREEATGSRYWMLETVREYAVERLEEAGAAAKVLTQLVVHVHELLASGRSSGFDYPDPDWVARVAAEEANVRVVLRESASSDPARFAEMCRCLDAFWYFRGQIAEGLGWLERSLDVPDLAPTTRVALLDAASNFRWRGGDFAGATDLAEQEVALLDREPDDRLLGLALRSLGNAYYGVEEYELAIRIYHEGVAASMRAGDEAAAAATLGGIGYQLMLMGNLGEARRLIDRAAKLLQQLGTNEYALTITIFNSGFVRLMQGHVDDAYPRFVEALDLAVANGFVEGIVFPVEALAMIAVERGDSRAAATLLGGATRLREPLGLAMEEPHGSWLDRTHATLHEVLGESGYVEALSRGAGLETSALVDLARSVEDGDAVSAAG